MKDHGMNAFIKLPPLVEKERLSKRCFERV